MNPCPTEPNSGPAGLLIALEGLDGVGKSTLAAALTAELSAEALAMPGLPRSVAHSVFAGLGDDPTSRCLFHAACARALGVKARELTAAGRHVIIDRYWLSSVAYARARGVTLDLDAVERAVPSPDVSVLVSLDEPERRLRLEVRGPTAVDRETMAPGFAQLVHAELTRADRGAAFGGQLLLDVSGQSPALALATTLALLREGGFLPPHRGSVMGPSPALSLGNPGSAAALEAREAIAVEGVAVLKNVVAPPVLAALREAVAANRANHRPMSRQVLYTHGPTPRNRPPLTALMDQWLSPFLYAGPGSTRAVTDALRPLAAELLGEPGVLFQDLLLVKREGQKEFPWHQDFGYWPVDRPLGVVLWVPLQPSDGLSGAVRFAVGSHRLGPRPVVDLHNGAPQDHGADLAFDPDAWPALAPTYAAGDAVAFTPVTFHASPAMRRPGERAAWSCIFLSPRARWSHANAPNHPLCKIVPDGALVTELSHA
ncbi:MAG: phytanoyl-CoA dioxygenase family protein [Myxococcota bacterium]